MDQRPQYEKKALKLLEENTDTILHDTGAGQHVLIGLSSLKN